MDWANERYVRVFTRDTPEWLCMDWQGRALWPLLLRKADRSGVIANKLGARGVAVLVALPLEVVEPGIAALLADGCLREHHLGLVIPNFLEAQETPQSNAQRQRESRERRRSVSKPTTTSQNVTECHERSRGVTSGHAESQPVTPDQTRPDKKKRSPPSAATTGPDQEKAAHPKVVAAWDEYYTRTHGGAKPTWNAKTGSMVKQLLARHGPDELIKRIGCLERSPPRWPIGPWDLQTFVQHVDKCVDGATVTPIRSTHPNDQIRKTTIL